jgi:hypothetical protein
MVLLLLLPRKLLKLALFLLNFTQSRLVDFVLLLHKLMVVAALGWDVCEIVNLFEVLNLLRLIPLSGFLFQSLHLFLLLGHELLVNSDDHLPLWLILDRLKLLFSTLFPLSCFFQLSLLFSVF